MATNYGVVDVQRQTIATGKLPGTPGLSTSNEASLQKSFPGSPIHTGELTRDERRTEFQKLALDGEVTDGFCFPKFNRNYHLNGAPKYKDVVHGAGGLPGSPFTPNPVSPGEGNGADPTKMGEPPTYMKDPDGKDALIIKIKKSSRPPFNGAMTDVDPWATSECITDTQLETLGSMMGKSPHRVAGWGSVSE